MNCNQAQQNLEPALDGALDEAAHRRLHKHVSTCNLCKEKLVQLEGVRALLRKEAPTTPSESLDSRVMGSFRWHHAAKPGRRAGSSRLKELFLGSLRVPVPIMAILLIAVMAIVLVAYKTGKQNARYIVVNPPPPRSEQLPASDATVEKTHPVYKTVPAPAIERIVQSSSSGYRRDRSAAGFKKEVTEDPIKSSTVIMSGSTSYSTVAVLKGFEPLPTATARIIKGEQR